VGIINPAGLSVKAYPIKIIMAKRSFRKVEKFGQLGFGSGTIIMNDPAIKAIAAIIYGNVLGPTGSAKNGDSSW
tara:strand:+ start:136 stop:357 length:222 start_codon:yes stop_codon:yes gene_type:complete